MGGSWFGASEGWEGDCENLSQTVDEHKGRCLSSQAPQKAELGRIVVSGQSWLQMLEAGNGD